MNVDSSFLSYFIGAGLVVKLVLLLLIGASVLSWTYIFQRGFFLKKMAKETTEFERHFWAGGDLSAFYAEVNRKTHVQGLEAIFKAGFKEYLRLHNQVGLSAETIMENARRAMRVAEMREQDEMELHLPTLATIGSIAPYVGLFGTVWGIMRSLSSLANVQQATIAMVAPGFGEALIATAIGLFAAIPAVIAYNRYANSINRLLNRFTGFEEEFSNILFRQTQSSVVLEE